MTIPLAHPVRGVVFDLDGTLTIPVLDFDAMRREIGLTGGPILEAIQQMGEVERRRALGIIERHEAAAARRSVLSPGARELLDFLREAGLKIGLVTRNSRLSVEAFCRKHRVHLDAVITRDDAPPKPSPEPVRQALGALGLKAKEAVFVGDHEIDRLAGEGAGVVTYIVRNHDRIRDDGPADRRLEHLAKLVDVIRGANSA
jgi:HAD superfamily hydrolase (TIGR01509 family)